MTIPANTNWDLEESNFVRAIGRIRPHTPGIRLGGIEIFGDSTFLNGSAGGDHLVYLDFEERYDLEKRSELARRQGNKAVADKLLEIRDRVGVLLADVSGHQLTDAVVAAMLHQAFLTGVLYELDLFGEVTTRLFENLNTRFFKSTTIEKYITLIYGEISTSGTFRFISAGHPRPLVFSAEFDRLVTISPGRLTTFFPLGMFPSEGDVDASRELGALRYKPSYTINEVNLMGVGDILLLVTDGYAEHAAGDKQYLPERLEMVIQANKARSAEEIYGSIRDDALAFAPAADDLSLVVIKRGQ
jgi:serine phosphatase RsbU (regulator of sigma subunit)